MVHLRPVIALFALLVMACSASPTSYGEDTANSPSDLTTTFDASIGFGGVQGANGWDYGYGGPTAPTPMGFVPSNADTGGSATWKGNERYLLLWSTGGHPGDGADAVRRWIAPSAGTAHVTGTALDADASCGDGVIVRIFRDGKKKWSAKIKNGNTSGVKYDLTFSVSKGTSIAFVINKRGNTACDATTFAPRIELTTSGDTGTGGGGGSGGSGGEPGTGGSPGGCVPDNVSPCWGKTCGTVINNCGQPIACGAACGAPTYHGTGNGNTAIIPHFGSAGPTNPVGIRYKFRVDSNESTALKIIFSSRRFYNPSTTTTYLLEANLYSNWYQYGDGVCGTWPLQGVNHPGEAGLWLSVPDYPLLGKVGAKTFSSLFPRQRILIDGISGLEKIETISQKNMLGVDAFVEHRRGAAVTDKSGWKTCGSLDGDAYQTWTATAGVGGSTTHRVDFALPTANALYLAPWDMLSIYTEFLAQPGLFRAYFWDVEFLREGSSTWEPIQQFKLTSYDGVPGDFGYGFKLGTHNGRSVIEVSNDGTDTYFEQTGQIITVPAN